MPTADRAPGGWLAGARRVPSPNCDRRPPGSELSLLLLHSISLPRGQYGKAAGGGSIERLFTNRLNPAEHPSFADLAGRRVSAHFLIYRDGELVQFVPLEARAWHAGVSRWRGRERCNDFSIGVELEGIDDGAFEEIQYRQLTRLVQALSALTSIRYITGHSDVAPGRKTDPGSRFDWMRVYATLAGRK